MTQIELEPEAGAIRSLIATFFAAITAADTKALQALFYPAASLSIIRQDPALPPDEKPPPPGDNKVRVVLRTDIETFIRMVDEAERRRRREGRGGPAIVETPDLGRTRVQVDAGIATAWSPFEVTFDGTLHHYGTMLYTLARAEDGEGWLVHSLTQSYRRAPGWEDGADAELLE